MLGLTIILAAWFAFGAAGALLAYRGSMRDYGKNIYGWPTLVAAVVAGFPGFVGSMVGW